MKRNIYTIGHSNHSIEEFMAILIQEKIELVVDVRSLPGSKKYPQFNKENLIESLKDNDIKYEHLSSLGGLRNSSKDISNEINAFWENKSFHNYADYAMRQEFREGLNRLLVLSNKYKTVIMCAEVLWWRCHRRIITDYLLSLDRKVYHLFSLSNKKIATMTASAKINRKKLLHIRKKDDNIVLN